MSTTATKPTRKRTLKPTAAADTRIVDTAERFKLAGDPTRLRVILILAGGEKTVTELCGILGIGQPALSHHMAMGRMARIWQARRAGKCSYYSLTDAGRGIARAAKEMTA